MTKTHIDFIENYKRIIAEPTISAFDVNLDQTNKHLIDYLSNLFSEIGFKINIQPVPNARNKFNLLASIGSGEGGLLLAGHSDTVPYDEGKWQQDPFQLRQADNRLYGLGTCDMKGFFAFIYQALLTIPLNKVQKPLYILATADEETSMAGARFFAQQQLIRPDAAVIGEPTELKPIYKHKGHMAQSLSITGKAGHSSDPARGVNAIEIMYKAIGSLLDLQEQLGQKYRDPSFSVPETTMNLGHIHGGDGENRICGHCHLNFDVRPTPNLPDQEVQALLDATLAPLHKAYPNRVAMELMYPSSPAFACKNETQLIELAESLTGFSAEPANYSTEAPFLSDLGCDTLVLGPGSINQAHQPNEFIDLDYVDPTVTLLQGLIKQVCF